MSLFGTSPPGGGDEPSVSTPRKNRGGASGLFDDEPSQKTSSSSLFADDTHDGDDSPWSMPTPRKQQSRAEMIRNLLPSGDVPETYIETFDTVVAGGHSVGADGIARTFAAARLPDQATQSRIVSVVAPDARSDDLSLSRNEFNVLLALIGLAQEGEITSLDSVDERRRNLPRPKLAGLTAEPVLPPVAELAAKPPQTPTKDTASSPPSRGNQQQQQPSHHSSNSQSRLLRPTMDDPEIDPWNTPDMHKNHNHAKPNGAETRSGSNGFDDPSPLIAGRTISQHTVETMGARSHGAQQSSANGNTPASGGGGGSAGGWGGYFDGSGAGAGAGYAGPEQHASPFGGAPGGIGAEGASGMPRNNPLAPPRVSVGRQGAGPEEAILVTLMPEKEGLFMFQHHNYEVTSQRRGSKVVRRYSDFVWLLDCLHKRYAFRVLPLLPPKRVAVNGNHLSNDNSFIEKRRRGLARFLNALVRHPILNQEQLVVMFLTVPTHQELSVWRKQASISVQDEFQERALPPGLEESLPHGLEELFSRVQAGVKRSAELYINICNIMDRLVKRQEGVAADHGRVSSLLASLTETSADTYATDTNEIPLLNDGLTAMSKHLQTAQTLLVDESKGWEEGVLEDLKRQRDALVSVREMFERRERLDKDNIPYLERKIQSNETKLASLRSKPEGTIKAGEVERVAESIIKAKESIVQQHNRSIFIKECLRDELITFQSSQYHVSRWNQDWAGERVKYAEMLADNWRRLIDELEGMPLGD